jgi:hypothetical protein
MQEILTKETKQIRLWLPNDLYAEIAELKFKEKNVSQDIRDYTIVLIQEGLEARNQKK